MLLRALIVLVFAFAGLLLPAQEHAAAIAAGPAVVHCGLERPSEVWFQPSRPQVVGAASFREQKAPGVPAAVFVRIGAPRMSPFEQTRMPPPVSWHPDRRAAVRRVCPRRCSEPDSPGAGCRSA